MPGKDIAMPTRMTAMQVNRFAVSFLIALSPALYRQDVSRLSIDDLLNCGERSAVSGPPYVMIAL